jgi:hypothetical protein
MDKVKILFLAADPSDAARLRLGQELRDIRERLQLSKQRDRFLLESRESVRPGDITQSIHDVAPQIVHFSGHGTSTGELCFENILGKTQPIQPDALATLFELVAEQVSCVILNVCYSEAQAQAIAKHIPFVIGMNQPIGDNAAITFAVGFYKALGAGRSFEKAYRFAQVEMQLEGISENLTPVLYVKERKNSSGQYVSEKKAKRILKEVPEEVMQTIMSRAELDFPDDFATRKYQIDNEVKAWKDLQIFNPQGVPEDILEIILKRSEADFPDDYSTCLYQVRNQVEAWRELKNLDLPDVPQEVLGMIVLRVERDFPDDFSTRLYQIQNEVQAWCNLYQ